MFATLPIAAKLALRELSSPALCLMRVVGAALVFIVLQRVLVGERIASLKDYGLLALYSTLGVSINQLLYITALTMTTATAAQTLVAAGPAITLMVAILLRREAPTRAKWIGIALAGSGALVLIGAGISEGRALGNLLVTLNVAAYSAYLVVSRDLLRRYHPLTVITWIFIFGGIALVPFGAGPVASEAAGMTWRGLTALAWIIALPTVAAYYLNMWALTVVESSLVSTFVYLQPVMTALLAMPILGEHPSIRMVPAVVLIFAGVMVATRTARPSHDPLVVEP
jgi:drug/metabolite transporter (DMT)-like permease